MTVTPEIHLLESYTLTSLITKLSGWLKENFQQYVTIHGLDKYNAMFQNMKRVLHQNKPHTKIS